MTLKMFTWRKLINRMTVIVLRQKKLNQYCLNKTIVKIYFFYVVL